MDFVIKHCVDEAKVELIVVLNFW